MGGNVNKIGFSMYLSHYTERIPIKGEALKLSKEGQSEVIDSIKFKLSMTIITVSVVSKIKNILLPI